MSYKKIPLAGPSITDKEVAYVKDAVTNGFYETYDMHIKRLEKTFAEYLGVKYAIATFSGTHALHLATIALNLTAEDEVIVTDQSFIATAHAISYTGAKCVFVDIEEDTLCINPALIKQAITPKTKAIMLVHFAGFSCDMDSIMAIAQEHHLAVIEDACQAVGTRYKNRYVGSIGNIGTFSFQGSKIAVGGEGGMFVTNDAHLYERARHYGTFCRDDSIDFLWSDDIGYNYRISNVTAALILAQVERIEELITNKKRIFEIYERLLRDNAYVTMLTPGDDCTCNFAYVVGYLKNEVPISRDLLIQKLLSYNIQVRPGYPSMSLMPHYERRFEVPCSDKYHKRGIVFPSAHSLSTEDVEWVCNQLNEVIAALLPIEELP